MSELIPVRMLNEIVYCPRLFALEHVDGEWAESADTIRGRTVHRRVDSPTRAGLPAPEEAGPDDLAPQVTRSVHLGDPELGMVAKIDLVEASGEVATPVDYKKSQAPDVPEGAHLPERVQVCAQGLLLRRHGYRSDKGVLYFSGSRRRVEVPFTDELVATTLAAVRDARAIIESGVLPPPLVDSPRCQGCSLVGICLPDETNHLNGRTQRVRTLIPARDEGVPLYVEARGAKVARQGGEIVVKAEDRVIERVRISDTSRVVVTGAAAMTTPLMLTLLEQDVPVALHTWSGKLAGVLQPAGGHNVLGRIAQHEAASDPVRSLELARRFVHGKIHNHRVLLRRNGVDVAPRTLDLLRQYADDALRAPDVATLFGVEGIAARTYFEQFARMLKPRDLADGFDFDGRNRRPPRDPVNALLSFAYACLLRECVNVLTGIGLDAWRGFLHQPRPGKPSLALDLMEEFRALLADSAVIGAINNGVVQTDDLVVHRAGTALKDGARKRFIRSFERRMAEEITHPAFGTRMSYRRILEVQARLLNKALRRELDGYPPFKVR